MNNNCKKSTLFIKIIKRRGLKQNNIFTSIYLHINRRQKIFIKYANMVIRELYSNLSGAKM